MNLILYKIIIKIKHVRHYYKHLVALEQRAQRYDKHHEMSCRPAFTFQSFLGI